MTLVVAEKLDNKVIILSDTLLSFDWEGSPIHKHVKGRSTIKTIIINKNICISYAGSPTYAEEALFEISSSKKVKPKILNILVKCNKKSKGKTDFLVYFGEPNNELYIIKELQAPLNVQKCYIGLPSAYKKYTQIYKESNKETIICINEGIFCLSRLPDTFSEEEKINYSKMRDAFIGVINSSEKRIGGFVTSLIYESKEMKYLPSFTSNKKIAELSDVPQIDGNTVTYDFGKKEEGDYVENCICDTDFIALHFPLANTGVIYERMNQGLFYPEIKPKYDEIDFFDFLDKEKGYNRELSFLIHHNERHFAIKGNFFLEKKEYIKAIEFYDRAIEKLIQYKMDINMIKEYKDALSFYVKAKNDINEFNGDSIEWEDFSNTLNSLGADLKVFAKFLVQIKDDKILFDLKEGFKIILFQRGIAQYMSATTMNKEEIALEYKLYKKRLWEAYIDFSIVLELDSKYEKISTFHGSTIALLSL